MEGRLLARARAKQEKMRSANRAEENLRQGEVYASIPVTRIWDWSLRTV